MCGPQNVILLSLGLWAGTLVAPLPRAHSQEDGVPAPGAPLPDGPLPGIDEWAEAIAQSSQGRWAGQRVPYPLTSARPQGPNTVTLSSSTHPIALHASSRIPVNTLQHHLTAAEDTLETLAQLGWSTLALGGTLDGTLGGSPVLDVYLRPQNFQPQGSFSREPTQAGTDRLTHHTRLDGAHTHATVPEALAWTDIPPCTSTAITQALLRGTHPAEAHTWIRETARWVAYRTTGTWGCTPTQQPKGELTQEENKEPTHASAALPAPMLELLAKRWGDHAIHSLYEMARQHTWDGTALRGSPDLFETLRAYATRAKNETMEDLLVDLNIQYHQLQGATHPPQPVTSANNTTLPIHHHTPSVAPWRANHLALPSPNHDQPLRVWLRGEYGVKWKLVASRFDANGKLMGHIHGTQKEPHKAYLVVEPQPNTQSLLFTAINLSARLPDADRPDPNTRAATLILK